jgi:hypothetical protein
MNTKGLAGLDLFMVKVKKILALLFFPLPAIWLIAICLYWFATSPEPIDNTMLFFAGMGVFTIILEYLLTKNKVFKFAFIFAVPVSIASVCSLWILIIGSYAPEMAMDSFFIFGLLILIRLLVVEKEDWSVILVNVLLIPIFLFPVCAFDMYYPIITDTATLDGYIYILADTVIRDYDNRPMQGIYRCEESTLNCELLAENQGGELNVVVDRKSHVINLVRTGWDSDSYDLVFSFGKNSTISWRDESKISRNHIYQMSQECNNPHLVDKYSSACDSYTHTLYECDLDFTGCHSLSMKYTSFNRDEYFIWDVDENSHQINLFSDLLNSATAEEKLILTYGKNPQCYVDGCEIFGK